MAAVRFSAGVVVVVGGLIKPILCEAAGRKNNACVCEEGGTGEFRPRLSEENAV